MSTLLEKAKTEKLFTQTKPPKYKHDENEHETTSIHRYIACYLLTAIRNGKVRVVKVTS
jgi:hypothetical protein